MKTNNLLKISSFRATINKITSKFKSAYSPFFLLLLMMIGAFFMSFHSSSLLYL